MSPQNWLRRSERNPALDTHGDNAYSPQIPDTKLTVTSKVQFLQLQHVFRQKCKKHNPSRSTTHAAISTSHNSIFSQYSHPFTSLAAPKANQYSMLQIKPYSQKPISTLAILLHLHSTFYS